MYLEDLEYLVIVDTQNLEGLVNLVDFEGLVFLGYPDVLEYLVIAGIQNLEYLVDPADFVLLEFLVCPECLVGPVSLVSP